MFRPAGLVSASASDADILWVPEVLGLASQPLRRALSRKSIAGPTPLPRSELLLSTTKGSGSIVRSATISLRAPNPATLAIGVPG